MPGRSTERRVEVQPMEGLIRTACSQPPYSRSYWQGFPRPPRCATVPPAQAALAQGPPCPSQIALWYKLRPVSAVRNLPASRVSSCAICIIVVAPLALTALQDGLVRQADQSQYHVLFLLILHAPYLFGFCVSALSQAPPRDICLNHTPISEHLTFDTMNRVHHRIYETN